MIKVYESLSSDVNYLLSEIENKYGFSDMDKCLDFLLDHCGNIDEIEDGSGGYDLENAEYDINDSAIIRILRTYLKDRVIKEK